VENTETFEGVVIGGKKFPFKYLSITQAAQIRRKLIPGLFRSIGIAIITLLTPYNGKKRWWKRIRSVAFRKQGLWKLGIIPYNLRCSVIKPKEAEEAEENFFGTIPEIVRESKRLLDFHNLLSTENRNKNEQL
jgi:hypothetical protein